MAEELEALNMILYSHLNRASALWDERVYPTGRAPAGIDKPYLLFFWAGGGNDLVAGVGTRRNARLTLSIKGVALELAEALAIKAAVESLIDQSGTQDRNPQLPEHPEWIVTTATMDRAIYIEEAFEGAQWIYHAGNQYVFTMERRS